MQDIGQRDSCVVTWLLRTRPNLGLDILCHDEDNRLAASKVPQSHTGLHEPVFSQTNTQCDCSAIVRRQLEVDTTYRRVS